MTDRTMAVGAPHATAVAAPGESLVSGVTWSAVLAGAAVAAAVSLTLLILGSALGFAVISPWSGAGVSATTFGISAVIWLIVVQWIAFGLGGYLTGRLRTKWAGIHTDEVYFRDTAHGFLVWAIGTLTSALLAVWIAGAVASTGAQATATMLSGAAQGASQGTIQAAGAGEASGDPTAYLIDRLFRTDPPAQTTTAAAAQRGEATRIVIASLADGEMTAEDRSYLAQLVAARTGLSQADAEARIDGLVAEAQAAEAELRQAADTARQAAATLTLFTFLALLIGAFIACVAAAIGGRQRDEADLVPAAPLTARSGAPLL